MNNNKLTTLNFSKKNILKLVTFRCLFSINVGEDEGKYKIMQSHLSYCGAKVLTKKTYIYNRLQELLKY